MKFGVGQPVRRFEDQTLITGKGRYTDDIALPNMAQAYRAARAGRARQHPQASTRPRRAACPACCWC